MMRLTGTAPFAIAMMIAGCTSNNSEVFNAPADTWDARARQLSLNRRYEAFRYGATEMRPEVILDDPMADGGKAAAILILNRNESQPNDSVILASVHVYERMKARGIWSICKSTEYDRAKTQQRLIRDSAMRKRYISYLSEVCA